MIKANKGETWWVKFPASYELVLVRVTETTHRTVCITQDLYSGDEILNRWMRFCWDDLTFIESNVPNASQ